MPNTTSVEYSGLFPDAKIAHEDIPQRARNFLQQAFETIHAPDAAAVMAGSAVDAMGRTMKTKEREAFTTRALRHPLRNGAPPTSAS